MEWKSGALCDGNILSGSYTAFLLIKSLVPAKCGCYSKWLELKIISKVTIGSISFSVALRWMPEDSTNESMASPGHIEFKLRGWLFAVISEAEWNLYFINYKAKETEWMTKNCQKKVTPFNLKNWVVSISVWNSIAGSSQVAARALSCRRIFSLYFLIHFEKNMK